MQNTTSAEPEKGQPDWEAIQNHYRTGLLSIREIARQRGVTDTAIRKKARAEGWLRDLTGRVGEQVRGALVRSPVRTPHARGSTVRTEREIVETAAAIVVAVVREHRTQIASGQGIVQALMDQLMQAVGSRAALETEVDALSEEELQGQSRSALKQALSLASHAATLRDLSGAMKNLIGLERQAFNVDAQAVPEPVRHDIDAIDVKYRMLKAKMDERLGRVA
jgi:hypothetical protein